MVEDKIQELKKEYEKIVIPDYLISNGWLDLSLKLPEKGKFSWHLIFARGLVFASIVLFFSGAVVGVSQASKPGDILFPVKVLSEKVAVKAGFNPEISLVRRTNDLIDQSKKDSGATEKASEEYKKTLEQGSQDAQKSGKTKEFKQTLNAQEKKLREAQNEDNDSEELKEAVEETVKVQGEVKGERDSGEQNSNEHKSNSGHSNENEHRGSENSHSGDRNRD